MRKSLVFGLILGLLVGVAVTLLAQTSYVNVVVKYDASTHVPALGNVTPWAYAWRQVADSRGIAYDECDAACRRLIVAEQMRTEFNKWLYARISAKNTEAANTITVQQIQALQGVVE